MRKKLTEREVGQRGQVWGPRLRGGTCKGKSPNLCMNLTKIRGKEKMVTPRDEADDKGDEDG